jgi:hypothetical protein
MQYKLIKRFWMFAGIDKEMGEGKQMDHYGSYR